MRLSIPRPTKWMVFFAAYAMLQILWVGWVAYRHVSYPLNLESMETTVLEHVERVMQGKDLYAAPQGDHVALAYNPLFYYLCAAFAVFLGPSLFTIRLVALLGTLGCAAMLYWIVKRETDSRWWAVIAAGMFAAAYSAMDFYFDIGHRDTWMLFLILAGCSALNYGRTGFAHCSGMMLLVAAFWLKQQAAAFAIGGFLFLLFKLTPAELLGPGLLTVVFGPVLYSMAPGGWFGAEFHYFTWDVPRQWAEVSRAEVRNFAELLARRWFVPALLTGGGLMSALQSGAFRSIWLFLTPVAFGTAVLGMATPGSNNNVFIPFETWMILLSVVAIQRLTIHLGESSIWPQLALSLSFLALLYSPASALIAGDANEAYRDLLAMADACEGPIYAPWLGHVPGSVRFQPAAHWVPMDDMLRGPGEHSAAKARVAKILEAAIHPPGGHGYVLTNARMESDAVIAMLQQHYVLEKDFGERFRPLQGLTRRYTPGWPRYLYRYDPQQAEQRRRVARR